MEIQQDFKELLKLFNEHKVEYVIIGAYALAFYGSPRYTGDIDILVKPTAQNALNILGALNDFGFGELGLTIEDFSTLDKVIQLGISPVRIDITTSVTGVSWDKIVSNKVAGSYGDVPVFYIGRQEFIANKKAMGRLKDLADIESLGEDID